jgi:hypothetical protein
MEVLYAMEKQELEKLIQLMKLYHKPLNKYLIILMNPIQKTSYLKLMFR